MGRLTAQRSMEAEACHCGGASGECSCRSHARREPRPSDRSGPGTSKSEGGGSSSPGAFDFAQLSVFHESARNDSPTHQAARAAGSPGGGRLTVGGSDDPLEAEADRFAATFAGFPSAAGAAHGGALGRVEAPDSVREVLGTPGRPLDQKARGAFQSRLGFDLAAVRIHDDAQAARSARSIDAAAYTLGNHVVFASPQTNSSSGGPNRLLAHELAHVAQQRGVAGPAPCVRRAPATDGLHGATLPPSGSDVHSELIKWKRMFSEKRYGCFCGPGDVTSLGCTGPIDAIDSCCQQHDRAYDAVGVAESPRPGQVDMWTSEGLLATERADEALVACTAKTFFDPHWYGPAATAYRVGAALIFGARVAAAKTLRAVHAVERGVRNL